MRPTLHPSPSRAFGLPSQEGAASASRADAGDAPPARATSARDVADVSAAASGSAPHPSADREAAALGALRRHGGLAAAARLWTHWLREGDVEPADLDTVCRAQGAIDRTRAQLPWGRGNVVSDVVRTAEESTWRTTAGRIALPEPARPAASRVETIADRAAQARFMGAGNCDEFAALVQVRLAPHLRPSERLEQWGLAHPNHTWCELVQGAGTPHETRWVVDPWSEGPVLRSEDTGLHDRPGRIHVSTLAMEDAPALTLRHAERLVELRDATTPDLALTRARAELADEGDFPVPGHAAPNLERAAALDAVLGRIRLDLQVPRLGSEGADPGFSASSHPLRRVLPFIGAHAVARRLGAGLGEASAVSPLIVQAGVTLGHQARSPAHQRPEAEQRSTYAKLLRRAQAQVPSQAGPAGAAQPAPPGP